MTRRLGIVKAKKRDGKNSQEVGERVREVGMIAGDDGNQRIKTYAMRRCCVLSTQA